MIVYRELSSLTKDLGVSARALYSLSNHIHLHYHKTKIPKKNGEDRELSVPDKFLKAVQRKIVEKLLVYEEISPYAAAYRFGASTLKNAVAHCGKSVVLKLDIRHFFDHIIYPMIKEKVFSEERYSEENRVLLSILCLYNDSLPQGAPTSPIISNIIMKDFDNEVGKWCKERGISYTRYCDDMTFSGDFRHREVVDFVKGRLKTMGFFLNGKKTVVAGKGQKQIVTGIVVNEKANVPLAYRKKIRQELYYCKKFGISSHLREQRLDTSEEEYLRKMLGKVNYVLSVDAKNAEMQEYKVWLTGEMSARRGGK